MDFASAIGLRHRFAADGVRARAEDAQGWPADHVPLNVEDVVDGSVRFEKALRRVLRFEAEHLSLGRYQLSDVKTKFGSASRNWKTKICNKMTYS